MVDVVKLTFQIVLMSAGRTFGFGLLGAVLGAATGAAVGLVSGLVYTGIADITSFEGASGYAAAYWMLAGLVLGLFIGIFAGVKLARRKVGQR